MRFETAQIGGSSLDLLYFQKNLKNFVQQLNVTTNLNLLEIFKHIEPYYESFNLKFATEVKNEHCCNRPQWLRFHPVILLGISRFSVHSTGCQKNEKEIKEMKRSRADKRSDDAIAIPKKDQY